MNLLDYNDDGIMIAPEALALEPFRKVWESNNDKSNAVKEIAYVYFMGNKSNEFAFWQIVDEKERSKEIITFVFGNDSKYKPTIFVKDALDFYKSHITPYSSGLLEDALIGADKARQYIKNTDWNLTDKSGKFIYDPNKVRDLFLKLPDFDDVIQALKRKVKQEEQSDGDKKRGQHSIGMYERASNDGN